MKRYITIGLSLISWICLVAQTTKTYNIPFNREDFSITQIEEFHEIKSNKHDLRFEENFSMPAIPYVIVDILLPDMYKMSEYSFNVTSGQIETGVTLNSNPKITFTGLEEVSDNQSSLSYPKTNYPFRVDYTDTEVVDGYRIASFKVFPLSYNVNRSEITWASNVELNITTTPITSDDGINQCGHRGDRNELLQRRLLNPEEISECVSTFSITNSNNTIDYLIITSQELKPAFQLLAEWKMTKGVRTEIITIDSIYANYENSSNQLKIKNCINDYYVNKNTEYVLLGGDDIIIPVQRCYAQVKKNSNTFVIDSLIPTDLFYACLNEPFDWNPNADNYVGHENDSVNLNANVFLTRLPARTLDDAYAFIDKLLIYEQSPAETSQMTSMLLAGVEIEEEQFTTSMSYTHARGIRMNSDIIYPNWPNGTVKYFFDTKTDFEGSEQYDVTVENLQEQLGINFGYHFVQMDTHGDQCSWVMESGADYYSSDAAELGNPMSCIILTASCTTNAFDSHNNIKSNLQSDPCLSEAFIRNDYSGVVAYLGSSRSGWSYAKSTNLGPSLKLIALFYESLFKGEYYNYAKLVNYAKSNLRAKETTTRWLQYSVNPLGDPEMPIYTEIPQKFSTPICTWNGTSLCVDAGMEDCTITITDKATAGEKYFQTYKSVQQAVFSNLEKSEYTLCITKHNYIPYIATVKPKIDYIQKTPVNRNTVYTGNKIRIGRNVTTEIPMGDVTISTGVSVTIDASESVTLEEGFNCLEGAELEIK